MTELRLRPKGDYINEASWEELYHLTQYWQSEMDFYSDEMHFLYKLINQFFAQLLEHENIRSLQLMIKKIAETEIVVQDIQKSISSHLSQFKTLIHDSSDQQVDSIRGDHAELENRVSNLESHFKNMKKEIFELTEEVMKNEKLKHLLTTKT